MQRCALAAGHAVDSLSNGQIGLDFDLVETLHRQGFLSLPRSMFDQVNHIQLHYTESQAEEDCFRPGPADPCPLAQSVCAPAESFEGVILAWSVGNLIYSLSFCRDQQGGQLASGASVPVGISMTIAEPTKNLGSHGCSQHTVLYCMLDHASPILRLK